MVKFRVPLPKDTTAPSGYLHLTIASWTNGILLLNSHQQTTRWKWCDIDEMKEEWMVHGVVGQMELVCCKVLALAQGTHRFQVEVRDKAGNVGK